MIQIKPFIPSNFHCDCGGDYIFSGLLWQGLHVCEKLICSDCKKIRINSLPVNQAEIETYTYYPDSNVVADERGNFVPDNWFSTKLKNISFPSEEKVNISIEVKKKYTEVVILNTLDYIYGHSFLFLLNLQRIIESDKKIGVVVIIQPMLRWLVPEKNIAEIWTVKLDFNSFNYYYPDLSEKINSELDRFRKVWLSIGHLLPTNENIKIEMFSGINPYDFMNEPDFPGITFVWREDPDRLWIRNIYLLKGLKKLGFKKILLPFQFFRVIALFKLLKRKLGINITFSVAGLGKWGKFPDFIQDLRVERFNQENEKKICELYSRSLLVIGVHGSSMLLPSAHAGMAVSLMPSKRWGNFAEDIMFTENDVRLAAFQRRIIPLNLSIYDIRDIIADMVTGRDSFLKKFIHSEEL